MSQEQQEAVYQAKGLAKWFRLELTISIFGVTIIHWVVPPDEKR